MAAEHLAHDGLERFLDGIEPKPMQLPHRAIRPPGGYYTACAV